MDSVPEEVRDQIFNSGLIKRDDCHIIIGVFLGLSVISVIARIAIRLRSHRKLSLDDYFVFLALASLTAATALAYKNSANIYLSAAIPKYPRLAEQLNPSVFRDLLSISIHYIYAYFAVAWTAIFAIKLSFLAFFRPLISRVEHINTYYWIVVVFTVLSWAFVVAEPFILCPYFGEKALLCIVPSRYPLKIGLTGLVTGLDALTDIMIVSIPIVILRKAKMKLQQKIALGSFTCLSLIMVIMAITRVSKVSHRGVEIIWQIFWQYMEAVVAVLMASVTTFRAFLIGQGSRGSEEKQPRGSNSWVARMKLRRKGAAGGGLEEGNQLPAIPSAALTGLRGFIRRNNRSVGATTMMKSEVSTLNEEVDDGRMFKAEGKPDYEHAHVTRDWWIGHSTKHSPMHKSSPSTEQPSTYSGSTHYSSSLPRSSGGNRSF